MSNHPILTVAYGLTSHPSEAGRLAAVVVEGGGMSYNIALDGVLTTLMRLERHGTPPVLGSTAWAELPQGDPLRVASVYRAALMWTFEHDVDSIAERLKRAALDVAAGTDWAAESRIIRRRADAIRSGTYIERVSA